MKVLGIDPGSLKCGYGIVGVDGRKTRYVTSGTIIPKATSPLHERLKFIYNSLLSVIREHRPDDAVVEKIFFAKSSKAALSLGHARGIALLAAAEENVTLHEISALEVKKAVVGYGRAEKKQVEEMVKLILGIRGDLHPDSADALALALCFLNTRQFGLAVSQGNIRGRGM